MGRHACHLDPALRGIEHELGSGVGSGQKSGVGSGVGVGEARGLSKSAHPQKTKRLSKEDARSPSAETEANPVDISLHAPPASTEVWNAEQLATVLSARMFLKETDVLQLGELLPPLDLSGLGSSGRSWSFGSFNQACKISLRASCSKFPRSCMALTQFAKAMCPSLQFSAITVLDDVPSPLHKDELNHKTFLNWICPLSAFQGGEIRVEDSQGSHKLSHESKVLAGRVLDISRHPAFMDATRLHCVLPWKGRRVVMVCFMSQRELRQLGFPLPSTSPPDTGAASAVKPKAKPQPPMDAAPRAPFAIGTAGLTAENRKQGIGASFGIDHIVKAGCKAPVCKLDVTKLEAQARIKSWIQDPSCVYLHCGVPCGASSRARELQLQGSCPQPLRTETMPEGLPNLPLRDQQRVELANEIYRFVCSCILLCHTLNEHWSLEQPRRSLFWFTKWWKSVKAHTQPIEVVFHHCMFGGQRAKATRLATSLSALLQLAKLCNNQHAH